MSTNILNILPSRSPVRNQVSVLMTQGELISATYKRYVITAW